MVNGCRRVEVVAPALGDQIELLAILIIQVPHVSWRVNTVREKWTARNADRSRVTYSIVEGHSFPLSPRPSTPFPSTGRENEKAFTYNRSNIPSDIFSPQTITIIIFHWIPRIREHSKNGRYCSLERTDCRESRDETREQNCPR